MDIGERIKQARQAAGWSQEALGREAGVHPITIVKVETGRHRPTLKTLTALADALGLDAGELLTGTRKSA